MAPDGYGFEAGRKLLPNQADVNCLLETPPPGSLPSRISRLATAIPGSASSREHSRQHRTFSRYSPAPRDFADLPIVKELREPRVLRKRDRDDVVFRIDEEVRTARTRRRSILYRGLLLPAP